MLNLARRHDELVPAQIIIIFLMIKKNRKMTLEKPERPIWVNVTSLQRSLQANKSFLH